MAKKRKNQPARPGVHAELSGDNIILKGDGIALKVPLIAGPGPARPQAIEALAAYEFLQVLRLQKLGVDDLDRAAKILGLDRRTIRAGYSESLRTYSNSNAIESGLKSLFEQNHDYCEHSLEFRPLQLTGLYPDKIIKMRKERPALFRSVPNASRVAQLRKLGLKDEQIGKKMQFDKKDFQRWLEAHAALLERL